MSLLTVLNDDIKTAMKAKDRETLSVLRMLKTAVQNDQLKIGRELTAEEEIAVLSREMKQRKEALAEFEKAGREDLAEKATAEIAVVTKYLPEQLSDEALRVIVQEAIMETQATNLQAFGKVMGVVMPKVKGKADGNLVNAMVKELLQAQ